MHCAYGSGLSSAVAHSRRMVAAVVTCTIVLIIILATLVLGITAAFVASRYCKFDSGVVFVSPETTPSWEKPCIHQCPIPVCTVDYEGPPPLPPPVLPPPPPPIVNLQQLDHRPGPSYPPPRRHPQRTLQCNSARPNLCRLPPRRPINKPCKPPWLPVDVDINIPCKRPAYGTGPPQIIVYPCQPKQTKSPEGLRLPPAHDWSITAFHLSATAIPIWYDFAVLTKIKGTPNREPVFLFVVPSLVPFIPPVSPMPPVIVTTLIFYPRAAQSTRLEIEPHGGFRINLVPVSVRREPVRTHSPEGLPTPATNPPWCLCHSPAPMVPDPNPQDLIVQVLYPPEESPDPIPEPVTVTVTLPPPAPFIFPPPNEVSICLPLPDLPLPLPPFSGWPQGPLWPQTPPDPNTPPALPVEKPRRKAKAKPKGRPKGKPQRPRSTTPHRHSQSGYLTSTLGGPWFKKGYRPPDVEISDTPQDHYAVFWKEWQDQLEEGQDGRGQWGGPGSPSGTGDARGRRTCQSRERSKSAENGASSREPTPGPGHYNPEYPAVCGRIPGRVPGHPKLRRDPDIRL